MTDFLFPIFNNGGTDWLHGFKKALRECDGHNEGTTVPPSSLRSYGGEILAPTASTLPWIQLKGGCPPCMRPGKAVAVSCPVFGNRLPCRYSPTPQGVGTVCPRDLPWLSTLALPLWRCPIEGEKILCPLLLPVLRFRLVDALAHLRSTALRR